MADYKFSIERGLALELKERYDLRYFVETGTYKAETALWAAGEFDSVWTIEVDNVLYLANVNRIHNPKITFILGDSAHMLEHIVAGLPGRALIYLDAHWLDKGRNKRKDDCPLLAELDTLQASPYPHVVMIHDAHYILGKDLPPKTSPDLFPTLDEIKAKLPGWNVSIRKDNVVCLP